MNHYETFCGWLIYNRYIKRPMRYCQFLIMLCCGFAILTDIAIPYFSGIELIKLTTYPDISLGVAFLAVGGVVLIGELIWLFARWLIWSHRHPIELIVAWREREFQ